MILRSALFVFVTIALACGGGGTSGPSNVIVFIGNHTIIITVGPDSQTETCPGSVSSSTESGAFTGTLAINPCPPAFPTSVSLPVQGTISGNSISFTLVGQSAFIDAIEAEFGCTATRVDPGFQGTLVNDRIQAALTADFACQEGAGALSWSVDMAHS
jgi:hypothetical protein